MIFIIDDDVNVLRGFQILLKSADLECCVFDNVEEFLCKWNKNKDDLLILDIQMPGIDGCDLLDYLEKRHLKIPIIVITAYDQPESRSISDRYGVIAYLTKPVDSGILIALIKNQIKNPINATIKINQTTKNMNNENTDSIS
jgi:FixJ family two-component response regulator